MTLLEINTQAQIAFGLMLISALLVYIAFFRDAQKPRSLQK